MEQATQEFIERIFPPDEGELHQIYGKVKNGKSLYATKCAWEDLMRGQTVIANWDIKWTGYDERKSKWKLFLGLCGLKKEFLYIPARNFIFLDPTMSREQIIEIISRTTDAILYLDEGHRYFDSYLKTMMSMSNREIALLTAHFNRTIKIISQRPTAIHVSLRGNVNRFFKCEKTTNFDLFRWQFRYFKITEIQDMQNEMPDEDSPEQEFGFWGTKKWYARYNYKSMRGGAPRSQPNYAQIFYPERSDLKQWKNSLTVSS